MSGTGDLLDAVVGVSPKKSTKLELPICYCWAPNAVNHR